jgi:hypothetical protein
VAKCYRNDEGRAESAAFILWRRLEFFFDGERNTFAAVEDASNDEDANRKQGYSAQAKDDVQVLVEDVAKGVDDGRAEPDEEQRPDQEL